MFSVNCRRDSVCQVLILDLVEAEDSKDDFRYIQEIIGHELEAWWVGYRRFALNLAGLKKRLQLPELQALVGITQLVMDQGGKLVLIRPNSKTMMELERLFPIMLEVFTSESEALTSFQKHRSGGHDGGQPP